MLLLWALMACQTPFLTEVAVTGGNISGATNATGDIHVFKGIPFAAPPVGEDGEKRIKAA